MVNLGTIHWSVEVAQASQAASDAAQVQKEMGQTAEKAEQANKSVNRAGGALGKMGKQAGGTQGEMRTLRGTMGRFSGSVGLATTAVFFLIQHLAKLFGLTKGGVLLTGFLSALSGLALGKLLPTIGFGAIFTAMSVVTMLKLLPVIGIGAILGGLIGGELGELLGNESLGTLLGALAGGTLALLLGTVGIGKILTALGLGGLAAKLGTISIGAILTGIPGKAGVLAGLLGTVGLGTIVAGVGSVAALIFGIASLGDLVDGDISSWNLPAKFGYALGEGFSRAWPDMADKIHNAFTDNPVHDLGEWTGNVLRGEGRGAVTGENRKLSADMETGFIDPTETAGLSQAHDVGQWVGDKVPWGASGGVITQTGLMGVHEGETLVPAELDRSAAPEATQRSDMGGGVTIQEIIIEFGDQSLDIRSLSPGEVRRLAEALAPELGREVESIISP